MSGQRTRICRRIAVHLPGWFFLICGLALIGLTVVLPVRRDLARMQWRRDLMQLQTDRLAEQRDSYDQFHAALTSDDPIVLQRLAYYQLHLKPAGTDPLAPPGAPTSASDSGETQDWDDMPTIEALLHRPVPREGVNCRAPLPPDSRLTRLTSGTSRLILLAVGLVFVYVGMLLPIGTEDKKKYPVSLPARRQHRRAASSRS